MSLILDALNRADRERKNSQVTPDINTVHEASYQPSGSSLPRVVIVGAVVLVLTLLVLVYLLLQARNEAPSLASPAPVVQAPAPVSPPPAEVAMPAQVAAPVEVVETPVQAEPVVTQPQAIAITPSPEVHSLYNEVDEPQQNPTDDKISDLYKPVEESPVVESVPVQVPAVTSVSLLDQPARHQPDLAQPPPGENATVSSTKTYDSIHTVPDLRQLPWSVQQEIPTIIYSGHNFVPDGASNVVLNGQPRRVGNQVGGNLNLDEIYADGVLLRFREHRFKLRALNNWVNM